MVPGRPRSGPGPPPEDQKRPGGPYQARVTEISGPKFAPKAPLGAILGEFCSPGGPKNCENPPKIAKKGVRKAGRFTKLVLGGSGVDLSCFFPENRWYFLVFLALNFLLIL